MTMSGIAVCRLEDRCPCGWCKRIRGLEAERDAAVHDARHMRQILELIADQPGSKKSRTAARAALAMTRDRTWLRERTP